MVRLTSLLIAISILLMPLSAIAQEDDPQAIAQAVVDSLLAGDFVAAVSAFDSTMQAALPPEALQQEWETLLDHAGPFQEQLGVQTGEVQGYMVVIITLQFENGVLDAVVAVDANGQVAGLHFVPSTATPPEYEPPSYADLDAFDEREITVNGGTEWELPGTLSIPAGDGPFPAVVLVHGSGPNDRDETIGPNKPFRDLAWGLASHGIAVLRYDKRTLVHGQRMVSQSELTIDDETVNDALAAVDLLRESEYIDPSRIYVLGHSQGGYMAPRIAQRDPNLAGIIIMAGNTHPLTDLVLEQTRYLLALDGELSEADQAQIAALEPVLAATRQAKPGDDPATLLFGAPAVYWIDLNAYDPVTVAQQTTLPILILQGERDYQVPLSELEGWSQGLQGRDNLTITTYPDLNHLFMSGAGPANPQEYNLPGHVAETVITDLVDWVLNP